MGLIVAVYLTLAFSASAAVSQTILVDDKGEYPSGLSATILMDTKGLLTIADVVSPLYRSKFTPPKFEFTPFPDSVACMWFRLTLQNKSSHRAWVIEESALGLDRVDLFVPTPIGDWQIMTAGDTLPFADRDLPHRHYAFRVTIDQGQTKTFYLRAFGGLAASVTVWSADRFNTHDRDAQIVLGAYYGLIFALALYNLFLFVSLRDKAYLYYVLMILTAGTFFALLTGVGSQYLWPNSLWGFKRIHLMLAGVAVQTFLLTATQAPRTHLVANVLIGISTIWPALALADLHEPFYNASHVFNLAMWICILTAGIMAFRRGFRAARFFLAAWGFFALGAFLILLASMGVLTVNFFTVNGFQMGSAIEMILLSLALADRINVLQREKDAQEAELNTAHHMQMGLMPVSSPRCDEYEVAGRCIPADHVGGDFFQYFQSDDKVTIALADVSGHGMQAAIPMIKFSGHLESEIRYGSSITNLFENLNRVLSDSLDRRTFVCVSLGEFALADRVMTFANAGVPYPLHYSTSTGEVCELEVSAYPLGMTPGGTFTPIVESLNQNDRVVFCSDGIAEALNTDEEAYGFAAVGEVVKTACTEGLCARDVVDKLLAEVQSFAGNAAQMDDMTCVVVHVK